MNPAAPDDLLKKLTEDPDPEVQRAAVRALRIPAGVRIELSKYQTENSRRKLAANPNTSRDLLSALACCAGAHVRWRVARNRSAPPEAFAVLAEDTDRDVRLQVALNKSTSEDVLHTLTKDTDQEVVEEAQAALGRKKEGRRESNLASELAR